MIKTINGFFIKTTYYKTVAKIFYRICQTYLCYGFRREVQSVDGEMNGGTESRWTHNMKIESM